MLLVLLCAILLLFGLLLTGVWRRERLVEPAPPSPTGHSISGGLRFYAWWAALFLVCGTASGVLVIGAGSRLIMRLLALTSPHADGRTTETGAIVGEVTASGSLGLLLFSALPLAFASTAVYLLVAPWIPSGLLAGPVLGAILLVTAGSAIEPFRAANIDFRIVGPGWLALLLFTLLAVAQGAFLASFAGRVSRSLPAMTRRTFPATATPFLLGIAYPPVGVVVAVGAVVAVCVPRVLPAVARARVSPDGVVLGRAIVVLAVVMTMPSFAAAVISIAQRS